jgi:hypothetical protein
MAIRQRLQLLKPDVMAAARAPAEDSLPDSGQSVQIGLVP